MTPAEELAAAADRLDALAANATAGPWSVSLRGGGQTVGIEAGEQGYDEVVVPGEVRCGSYCYGGTSVIDAADADWRYIAAMNPLVGADQAALLREFAAHVEQRWRDFHKMWNTEQRIRMIGDHAPGLHAALRIARSINGSPADR